MAYPIRRFIDLLKKKLKNRHVLFNIIKFYFSFFITKSIFQYYFSKPFCKIHVKPFHIYFSLLQYGAGLSWRSSSVVVMTILRHWNFCGILVWRVASGVVVASICWVNGPMTFWPYTFLALSFWPHLRNFVSRANILKCFPFWPHA